MGYSAKQRKVKTKVEGADKLVKDIRAMEDAASSVLMTGAKAGGKIALDDARRNCPVDTELSLKKLTGLCYATDELLQDAAALEAVIRQAFAEEFGFKIDDAILSGSGEGEPLGILNSGAIVTVAKEASQTDTITVENLIKMWNRLWSRSRANAVWYINQELEPYLYTLKIGDKPVYIPAGGLSEKPYGTLFGRPVVPIEQCSAAGEVGDIILADIGQYLLIDKGGIKSASSIHVRFLYDENVFRFIYRVDGKPIWTKPLTPYKGSATVSPFVTLAKRGA